MTDEGADTASLFDRVAAFSRRTPGWLRRVGRWVWEAKPVFVLVAGFLVVWVVSFFLANTLDAQLRVSALLLETSGLAVVGWELLHLRERFGRESIGERVRAWFVRFPRFVPEARTIHGHTAVSAVAAGSVDVSQRPAVDATLEDRVKLLETQVKRVRKFARELDERRRKEIREVREALEEQKDEQRSFRESVEDRLEETAIGGMDYELVGLFWIVAGLILGNLTPEVAGLFDGLPLFVPHVEG